MLRRWWRKVQRRKPGVYLVRTNRHADVLAALRRPGRRAGRENGYTGRSVHVGIRRGQHLGRGRAKPKPWTDLDPVWWVLRLPWWLGWVWVLAPLEALAILITLPRYNDSLNHRNPRRVPLSAALAQRETRDRARAGLPYRYHAGVQVARLGGRAVQALGALLILTGIVLTIWR